MGKKTEKFTIEVKEREVIIQQSRNGQRLVFTPLEALMLLDILTNEEPKLKKLAEKTSPLPIKFSL